MPRLRRRGHKLARVRRNGGKLTRTAALELMVDAWLPDETHEALIDFTPEERKAILAEALVVFYERRWERRRQTLLVRLTEWPVHAWGGILSEQPELRDNLTEDQRERWQEWLNTKDDQPENTKILAWPEDQSNGERTNHD